MRVELGEGKAIELRQGDLTTEEVDAIVNAANESLMGGGGVDGAIHRAGGPAILADCKAIVARQGPLPTGRAVATTGGNLKARHVIQTVGPIWYGGTRGEPGLLASCHVESVRAADDLGLGSIAFPAISTGVFGYPVDQAAATALTSTIPALRGARSVRLVRFVLFGRSALSAFEAALTAAAGGP